MTPMSWVKLNEFKVIALWIEIPIGHERIFMEIYIRSAVLYGSDICRVLETSSLMRVWVCMREGQFNLLTCILFL